MKMKRMLRRRAFRTGLFAFLALTWNAAGEAALMRYEFGGTITSAAPSTGITPGTRFSGTFTYDPAGKPTGAAMIEGTTDYSFGHSVSWSNVALPDGSGITLQVGDKTVLSNPGGVFLSVSEQEYPGQLGYRNADGTGSGPSTSVLIGNAETDGGPLSLCLNLSNPSRSVFHSLAPPTSFNLADFPMAQLSVTEGIGTATRTLYAGTIDTLKEVPVPEPTWATLLCLTGAGWLANSSRRA